MIFAHDEARVNSTCFLFSDNSNATSSIGNMKTTMLIPGLLLSFVTLVLAGIILIALKQAGFHRANVLLLYFNVTVTDTFMAISGIIVCLLPGKTSFGLYQDIAIFVQILR